MKIPIRKNNALIKIINNSLIDLPTPSNISYFWNFGSLLGLCLIIQIITGLLLTMHYCPNIEIAYNRISHICRDVNFGWLIRIIHANGASIFFICIYIHIGRGLYYNSFNLINTWITGTTILFLTIGTAFLGYVLPWGQISFWGATVITNLVSAIPYLGNSIVIWLWGGFAIDNATLNRFYSLHFIIPFIIRAIIIIHLLFLHNNGSRNPLGTNSNIDKIRFHPYFSLKDLLGFLLILWIIINITTINPYILRDPDNFITANPLSTPVHIQPEWYFLFAYAILRSIPNKLGGVIALIISIAILYLIPFINKKLIKNNRFYSFNKILFWIFIIIIFTLTWIGAKPVEEPFIITGQIFTLLYFIFFIINSLIYKIWDYFIFK